jgi:prepilin-type N-terminal cleavage/methylation domain-containing protein
MMDKKGFTLIELLLVMVIIGILLAIAGISGKTWLDKYRVETQMKEMAVDLMNARVSAMQRNRMYFMVFNPTPTATQYTIYEDTGPGQQEGNGTFEPADRQVLQKSFNSNYALTIPGVAVNSINFDPKGLASMSPGQMGPEQTIRVAATFGAAYDCIVISATKIRMGVWNGANCVVQ